MKRKTRSILEELNNLHRDNDYLIDATANNIIESSINLISRIHSLYDETTALELEKRFISSIKTSDPNKFKRGIRRIIETKINKE